MNMSLQILARAFRLVASNGNGTTVIQNSTPRATTACACSHLRFFSMKPSSNIVVEVDPETGDKKKKKTTIIPKITLLTDNQIHVVTVGEAQKLAKRRDLKLVKIVDLDTKTQRPIYKLMTGLEYYEEDIKQREKRKQEKQKNTLHGEKVLILSQNITEHDLITQINKILKWIQKQFEIRVVINGDVNNMNKAEKVYSFLEEKLKTEGRVLQKRQKGADIKFQILPPKREKHDGGNNSDDVKKDETL